MTTFDAVAFVLMTLMAMRSLWLLRRANADADIWLRQCIDAEREAVTARAELYFSRELNRQLAERVAAQSELLSRSAEIEDAGR